MTIREYDSGRRLVDVPGSYRLTIERRRDRWLAHCPMCKHRASFVEHAAALAWVDEVHPRSLTHEKWTGRLAMGGHLSVLRGYDINRCTRPCYCGVCDQCDYWDGIEARRRARVVVDELALAADELALAADELARRRVAPPPTVAWQVATPGVPSVVRWTDGRTSRSTRYRLLANGRQVGEVHALHEGGWVFNGHYCRDDATLTARAWAS